MTIGARRSGVAAVTVLALGALGCGGTTPAADVAPEIEAVCADLQRGLDELAAVRTETPTVDDVGAVEDEYWAAFDTLPDTDTTAGNPRSVLGDPIQQTRRALLALMGIYNGRDAAADTAEVSGQLDEGVAGLETGVAEFEMTRCLDAEAVRADLQPLLDGAATVLAALEPTGDFEVDFAAACERFRADVADAVLETLTEPSSGVMGPVRAAGVMERFGHDLGNFAPPAEAQERYDALLVALEGAETAADGVLPASQVDQAALDAAVDEFVVAETAVNEAIAAIDPAC